MFKLISYDDGWENVPWEPDFKSELATIDPDFNWGHIPFTKTVSTSKGPVTVTVVYQWDERSYDGPEENFVFKGPFNTLSIVGADEYHDLLRAPLDSEVDHPSFRTIHDYLENRLVETDLGSVVDEIRDSVDLEDLISEQQYEEEKRYPGWSRHGATLSKNEALPKLIQYLQDIDFGHGGEDTIKKLENTSTMLAALGIKPIDVDLAIGEASKGNWEKARSYIYGPSGRGSNLGALGDLQALVEKKAVVRVSRFINRFKKATTSGLAEEIYTILDSLVAWDVRQPNPNTLFLTVIKDRWTADLIYETVEEFLNDYRKQLGLKTSKEYYGGLLWEGVMGGSVRLELAPTIDPRRISVAVEVREHME